MCLVKLFALFIELALSPGFELSSVYEVGHDGSADEYWATAFAKGKRSFRPWNQRGRFHSPRPILAIEGAFPIPSQGPEPDILFRLVGLPVPVVAPAPLGGPDAGPAGGPVNGAGVARGLDEGLDEHGRGVVALGPVIGQAPADEGQDVRTQVGDIDPGQDQESRVVDHEGKVLLAQSAVSIR